MPRRKQVYKITYPNGKIYVGMDLTEFVFPCYFLGDPNLQPPPQARNLLGLTGVISQICLTFDGRSSVRSPRGVLVVEM